MNDDYAEIDKKLRAPFTKQQIGKLPKVWCRTCSNPKVKCDEHKPKRCGTCKAVITPAHNHVDFVGHAHVTQRLLEVDPAWNWVPMGIDANGMPVIDEYGGLWIKLTIGPETRIGYGHADGRKGGDATLIAIGHAIRIAAMRFGVALEQWMKEAPDAPAPAGKPAVEEATLTPAQRAGQLRALIAQIGAQDDKTIDDIAAEFREWSNGTEINTASVAVLAEYLEHLKAKP